ncbi:hypothetical protein BD779DRAFT_1546473 [Infundibulicybe gibba]|nr:hypothetical protein BD779DRAFT_1546473 [Infundibulicybe gibba]
MSGKPEIVTQSSERVSDTIARLLIFSSTEFTDEDAYIDVDLSDFGKIAVEIWIAKDSEPVATQDYGPRGQPAKIHERMKKAFPHQVIFGEEFSVPAPTEPHIWVPDRQVMAFIFKYRPQDYLRESGIIPLDHKPSVRRRKRGPEMREPGTSEDEAQLQNEELRLCQEELRVRREKLKVKKRELQIQKEEMGIQRAELQIQKGELQIQREELQMQSEELQIQSEELKMQLDTIKAKTRGKKAKLESHSQA